MKAASFINFINRDFDLLDKRNDRLFVILTCMTISIIFTNVFVPFNVDRWFRDSGIQQFMRLSSYGVVFAIVFLLTQFPLRRLFGIARFKVKTYLLWLFIELSIISMIFVFMYDRAEGDFLNDYIFSLKYTFLGILIPYVIALLVVYIRNQQVEIKKLNKNVIREYIDLISFKDENQNVKFSLKNADLLFLESTDNYVAIYYMSSGKIKRSLIRNTLKALEEKQLPENIIRSHRSYMVNLMNIEYIRKRKRIYQIKLKNYDTLLSVSQKYKQRFQDILN